MGLQVHHFFVLTPGMEEFLMQTSCRFGEPSMQVCVLCVCVACVVWCVGWGGVCIPILALEPKAVTWCFPFSSSSASRVPRSAAIWLMLRAVTGACRHCSRATSAYATDASGDTELIKRLRLGREDWKHLQPYLRHGLDVS